MASWFVLTLGAVALWGLWGFLAKIASDYLNPRSAAAMQGLWLSPSAYWGSCGSSRSST